MKREPIYAAAFQFFAGLTAGNVPLFATATRKPATWENVAPEEQPALLLRQNTEHGARRRGQPTIWTLTLDLMLYVHTGAQNDSSIVPSQILNPLLDAIEASLKVDDASNNACTLGGLVSHCAIEGPIQIFLGNLGDEAVAIVPIQILTSP